MVDYVTQTGMETTFGTGRIATVFSLDTGTVFNTGVFNQFRDRAEAWIDGMFGQMYSTPFTTGTLTTVVTSITEIVMFTMAVPDRRTDLPPEIQSQIEMWEKYLEKLLAGTAVIPGLTGVQHREPFVTNVGGVPNLRRPVYDREGEDRINTDILPEEQDGELGTW